MPQQPNPNYDNGLCVHAPTTKEALQDYPNQDNANEAAAKNKCAKWASRCLFLPLLISPTTLDIVTPLYCPYVDRIEKYCSYQRDKELPNFIH